MSKISNSFVSRTSRYFELEHSGVPIKLAKLKSPKVLWVNPNIEQITDGQLENKDNLHEKIIDKFAWVIPNKFFTHQCDEGSTIIAQSDRYGVTGGGLNGGSGRCAILGKYLIKGCGRTPLVSERTDWGHSHGMLSFTHAIRGAIGSEIVGRNFPHGGIPVVAILDTGVKFNFEASEEPEAAVLLIRPNFIRGAHLERSLFFGHAGTKSSEQYLDALRVKDCIEYLNKNKSLQSATHGFIDKSINQVAYSLASRLWIGQYTSSNFSLDGQFADYGAFRAVYSYERAVSRPNSQFGGEANAIHDAAKSMLYYSSKYTQDHSYLSLAPELAVINRRLIKRFELYTNQYFSERNSRLNSKTVAQVSSTLLELFINQQQHSYQLRSEMCKEWKRPWVYDAIKTQTAMNSNGIKATATASADLIDIIKATPCSESADLLKKSLLDWLKPQTSLMLEFWLMDLKRLRKKWQHSRVETSLINDYINKVVASLNFNDY